MIEVRLKGERLKDKVTAHNYLKKKLSLPEYYGNNLDALWDYLSTDFSPKKIKIYNSDKIIKNLGSYGKSLIKLSQEISRENDAVKISFH